jgi:hypothetical protein
MKKLKGILVFAVLVAVFIGWKMYDKRKASAAVREQSVQLLHSFPKYDENKAYYDGAFDELHGEAFDQAYKMGGRRTSASFDERTYLAVLVALYQRKAKADGKAELADDLELHRAVLQLPVVEFPE